MTMKSYVAAVAFAISSLTLLLNVRLAVAADAPTEYRAEGTWQSSTVAAPGKWTAILFKSASSNALGGTISIEGATVISDATVQGSMDGSKVTFGVVVGKATMATFSGSSDGEAMSGTYTLPQLNDAGSWKGTLTEVKRQAASD